MEVNIPFWSILITTYGEGKFLKNTIDSVVKQFRNEENFEIVIVDDCTPEEIFKEKIRDIDYNFIRIFRNNKNLGINSTFNKCLEIARGKLIHIIHDDDFLEVGFYKEIKKLYFKNPKKGLFTTRFYFQKDGKIINKSKKIKPKKNITKNLGLFVIGPQIHFVTTVINSNVIDNGEKFNEEFIHTSDWEFWSRISCNYGIVSSEKILGYYREHDSNDTSKLILEGQNILDRVKCIEFIFKNSYLNLIKGYYFTHRFMNRQITHLKKQKNISALNNNILVQNTLKFKLFKNISFFEIYLKLIYKYFFRN